MADGELILDFKTVKEEWTDYELEDGSFVRLKVMLNYLEKEGDHHSMNVRHLIAVWVPPTNRNLDLAEPALPAEALNDHIEQEGVKSDVKNQGQSVYKTSLGIITLEPRAVRFHRSSKYDLQGSPQYVVEQEIRALGPQERHVPGERKSKKRPPAKKK